MHPPALAEAASSFAFCAAFSVLLSGLPAQTHAPAARAGLPPVTTALPASFVANQGQWDGEALFRSRKGGATSWFTRTGFVLRLLTQKDDPHLQAGAAPHADAEGLRHADEGMYRRAPLPDHRGAVVRMVFEGSRGTPPVGADRLPGYYNFLIGRQVDWRTAVPTFAGIRYPQMYDGVDVVVREGRGLFKYDVRLAAGADLGKVVVRCEGADRLSIADDGALVLHTAVGDVVQEAPVTFHVLPSGAHRPVPCSYRLLAGNRFGFAVEGASADLPLVIDPDLDWSSYVGTGGEDQCFDVARQGQGATALVTVSGRANASGFPWGTGVYQQSHRGDYDAFVARFDPAQTGSAQLVWGTYLGGSGADWGLGVDVDLAGFAVVVGMTASSSTASPFPTLNAQQGAPQGLWDAFVTRLTPAGAASFSTYLGGTGYDWATGVVVDSALTATVVGYAASSSGFPMKGALRSTLSGPRDISITRFDSRGAITCSTYEGGSRAEGPNNTVVLANETPDSLRRLGVGLDRQGNLLVAGVTWSQDYPLVNPHDSSNALCSNTIYADTCVTRYAVTTVSGNEVLSRTWSTYLGAECWNELAYAIGADRDGVVTVAGLTESGFPVTAGAAQGTYGGGAFDAYVAWLDPRRTGGAQLIYATYLGGTSDDVAFALHVDDCGVATVCGYASSGFYTTTRAATPLSLLDAYVTKIVPRGSGRADIAYSTFLGGSDTEAAFGLVDDGAGGVFVAGGSRSGDHPTTTGAWQTSAPLGTNGWVAHVLATNAGVARHGTASPQPCAGGLFFDAVGAPQRGSTSFALRACDAEADARGFLALSAGLSTPPIQVGSVDVYGNLPILLVPVRANARGELFLPVPMPATLTPNSTVLAQLAFASNTCGLVASNALLLTVQ